jgi:serine/threonine-protein kinase
LLFGILALQLDFIDRDALIAALHAWVLDKTRSLGDILRDQGALRPDTHTLVEALVQKHLEGHANDPQQSLAALSPVPTTRVDLRQFADPDVQASWAHVSAASTLPVDPVPSPPAPAAPNGLRYHIVRPHARGGLGTVYVAEDIELHRQVALKEIQERHADNPISRERFLLEAEITGNLEHPGIVPVYGLGTYPDGRPFYAMRLIRGDTLLDAIRRFHVRPDFTAGEFRQLLRRFLDVCNAVAYAHSRGILHRDLKPGNVMLGKFGETLVVDWGLAKSVGRPEAGAETVAGDEATLRPHAGSGSVTVTGQAVGTPAYMSPEQAAGRTDDLGPASDVYSLGATLYVLLANRPPFHGEAGAILQDVRQGRLIPPRQVCPAVPPPLDAVCRKAMAREPADRYPSPLALAADLERWLADEPVSAYPDPWGVRAGRWMKRHRSGVAAAGALLVTAVVALAVSTVLIGRERDAKARAFERAEEQRQRAVAHFATARRAVDKLLTRVGGETFKDVPHLEHLRREILQDAAAFNAGFLQEEGDDPSVRQETALAYARLGEIRRLLGEADAADQAYREATTLYERLAADFPDEPKSWDHLPQLYNNAGILQHDRGRVAEAAEFFRRALARLEQLLERDPRNADYRRELANVHTNRAGVLYALGRPQEAVRAHEQAIAAYAELAAEYPTVSDYRRGHARALSNLGGLSAARSRPAEAKQHLSQAVQAYEQLVAQAPGRPDYRDELATTYLTLAGVLQGTYQLKDADEAGRHAVEVQEKLVADFPGVPGYRQRLAAAHYNRSSALALAGRLRDAEAALREAHALQEKLVAALPTPQHREELARCDTQLGLVLAALNQRPEAEKTWRQARERFGRLLTELPQRGDLRHRQAVVLYSLGVLLSPSGRTAEAELLYREAIDLWEQTVRELAAKPGGQADSPTGRTVSAAECQNDLGKACYNLAESLLRHTERTEARRRLEQGLSHQRAALAANPAHPEYRQVAQALFEQLLDLLLGQKDHAATAQTAEALAQSFPTSRDHAYRAARYTARCVELAGADPALAAEARAERARAYGEQAVKLLDAAVRLGYGDVKQLQTAADFQPLHGREDFRKLLAGLADREKKPADK